MPSPCGSCNQQPPALQSTWRATCCCCCRCCCYRPLHHAGLHHCHATKASRQCRCCTCAAGCCSLLLLLHTRASLRRLVGYHRAPPAAAVRPWLPQLPMAPLLLLPQTVLLLLLPAPPPLSLQLPHSSASGLHALPASSSPLPAPLPTFQPHHSTPSYPNPLPSTPTTPVPMVEPSPLALNA